MRRPFAARSVQIFGICFLIIAIGSASSVAIGDIIVSNITNADNGSAVGVNFGGWQANSFTIDNQAYVLDSVAIKILTSIPGGNFVLSIYDDGIFDPGTSIATLTGPTSPGAGTHTYLPSSTVSLEANTTYWVVAADTINAGNYFWTTTSDLSETGPGTIGDFASRSQDQGLSWPSSSFQSAVMFRVDGTPVPEPSACALLCIAGMVSLGLSRKQRHLQTA